MVGRVEDATKVEMIGERTDGTRITITIDKGAGYVSPAEHQAKHVSDATSLTSYSFIGRGET